jgi:two-component system, OmpR family, KDP operon response regulator KdpE
VRANLRRHPLFPREGPEIVALGGVEINLGTRHASVDGRDIPLTPKEFKLLHYLLMNPNVTVPHSKILQTIWGPDYGNDVEYLHVFHQSPAKEDRV